MKRFALALILIPSLFLVGCGLATLAEWAPVGLAAFDGVVAIIASPTQSAKLQADAQAVNKLFFDLEGNAANGATDLAQIEADLPLVSADIAPLVPAKEMAYVNAAFAVIETTIAVYEAQFHPAAPVAKNFGCAGYQEYGDGSFHVWADCAEGVDPIDAVTGGQAAIASPKVKGVKNGSFKRQFNAIARHYGHSENQLAMSLSEHLRLK